MSVLNKMMSSCQDSQLSNLIFSFYFKEQFPGSPGNLQQGCTPLPGCAHQWDAKQELSNSENDFLC